MTAGALARAMELNCEGCAGCCIDWRPLADSSAIHERDGPGEPLDDIYNLVPLTRQDVRALVDGGLADAAVPRFWSVETGGVTVEGHRLAAIDERPVFYLGLRTPPKPVAPFGTEPRWLNSCIFLDPQTLQCRIHESDIYPSECSAYPGHNLALEAETECERVEAATGTERLLDRDPPEELGPDVLGPAAVGHRLFVVPDTDLVAGLVDELKTDTISQVDRAKFVATAAASAPGTTEIDDERYEAVLQRARRADSWAGSAIEAWQRHADVRDPDPDSASAIEDARGAPSTPGWE
jgi:Fe-S-cluster containining protein